MRRFAFFAPLAAVMAVAAPAAAVAAPEVTVVIGADLGEKADELGEREVQAQADRLAQVVTRALSENGALDGARIHLVLTDLKPNHPTFQQTRDQPGLSPTQSVSIGGASIEGEVVTADGARLPVRYSHYSSSIDEVRGFTVWEDAERAYQRLAANLVRGRLVSR